MKCLNRKERKGEENTSATHIFTLAIFPFISVHVFKSLLPLWGTEPKKLESYNEKEV